MKKLKTYFSASLLCAVLWTGTVNGQELPKPSSSAKVEQRIGLTDITVKYSRPSVKDRAIFGELVAYNEVWRTGANEATLVTVSDDITIKGQKLAAGTYSLFTKPTTANWTVYFNTVTDSWGTGNYDEKNNVVTLEVKPETGSKVESMRFTFENVNGNKGNLVFAWDKVSLSLPIEVEVESKVWANIDKALAESKEEDKWSVYRSGASYCVQSKSNYDKGLAWITKSIDLKETWYSYWVKADLEAAKNDKKAAISSAKKAIKLGEADAKKEGKDFKYKTKLEGLIEDWKKTI